jgi:hypothetical protein
MFMFDLARMTTLGSRISLQTLGRNGTLAITANTVSSRCNSQQRCIYVPDFLDMPVDIR